MVLNSDRLKVEIAEPGIFPADTSRFDWCGFITSINLDGAHEFCAAEPTNLVHPSTGGIGLCNEYLCPDPLIPKTGAEQSPGWQCRR